MNEPQKETTAATVVSKESLNGLDNFQIAAELYRLIENRSLSELREIARYIEIIAVNKKEWQQEDGIMDDEAFSLLQGYQSSQESSGEQCNQQLSQIEELSCTTELHLHATPESVAAESQTRVRGLLPPKDSL
ncbi:hypothetical protein MHB46_02310 [Paenibacillus sp. FSL H7-0703]|uniref:hypothetical protein n=1 Tax=unclassified Paenibacillus TaxID=185978 RepID=UPI0030D2A51E